MRNRYLKPLLAFAACALVLVSAAAIFSSADRLFNGMFADWFEKTCMMTVYMHDGTKLQEVNWDRIKELLFLAFLFLLLILAASVSLAAYLSARNGERRTVTELSGMLRESMTSDREADLIFPPEYAEISAQVTALKAVMQRHEQVLREETSRKNDLISYLAHDLKTPLTSVIGYLSLLDEIPDMPQEQRAKYVHISLDKARRLEGLINEFFEITRYNLQQIQLEKETVDLDYMLVQLSDEFYPLLQAHGNRIELETDGELTVCGDPDRLARVFNNILKNAIAYSCPGTAINIRAAREGGTVSLCFENEGRTIPAHRLEAIFEKFFRLDEARASGTGGAGLGLAIAKEIVELHGGTIRAESGDEKIRFYVELPAD